MRFRQRHKRRQVAYAIVEHLDTLFRVALRLTGDVAEAEDLVQDTCLRAQQAAADMRHTQRVKSWLLKILTHRYIDTARQRAWHPTLLSYDDGEHSDHQGVTWVRHRRLPAPEHLAMQRELQAALKRALDGLPPAFRLAVCLVYVEGLTYQEAAEIMDCPLGTVMSRLARGKSLLRQRLRELEVPQTGRASNASGPAPGNGRVPLRVVSPHDRRHQSG